MKLFKVGDVLHIISDSQSMRLDVIKNIDKNGKMVVDSYQQFRNNTYLEFDLQVECKSKKDAYYSKNNTYITHRIATKEEKEQMVKYMFTLLVRR
jgi:hypothetical protein